MKGMLTLLEHLNFKVPYKTGEKQIQSFFVEKLGCPECPTGRMRVSPPVTGPIPEGEPKQMHVNLGLSQIHFEWCTGDGRPYTQPQHLEGSVTLAVRDMNLVRKSLSGTPHRTDETGNIITTDPMGLTTWILTPATEELKATVAKYGQVRAGGVGNILGMIRVDYNCKPGLCEGIARFYNTAFHAPISKSEKGYEVKTNFGQIVAFHDSQDGLVANAYDIRPELWGLHMCFYIENFSENSKKLSKLFWVNPDYKIPPINDNVSTVEAALERKQFRLKRVGEEYVFEHEIRATDHPLSPLKTHSASHSKL